MVRSQPSLARGEVKNLPHAVGREFLGRCLDVLAAEDLERLLQRLDLLLAHPHLMAEQNWRARLRYDLMVSCVHYKKLAVVL